MIGNEADPDLTKALNEANETRKCLQRCELQTGTMMTTTSTFPNRETFPYRWATNSRCLKTGGPKSGLV